MADNKEEVKAEGETEQMASSEKEDVAQTGETYEADQIKLKMWQQNRRMHNMGQVYLKVV